MKIAAKLAAVNAGGKLLTKRPNPTLTASGTSLGASSSTVSSGESATPIRAGIITTVVGSHLKMTMAHTRTTCTRW